ncbi:fec operon regulator FecR [compost metagenome]
MTSTSSTSRADADVIAYGTLQQAAEWFALLRSDSISDSDRAGWQTWLSANAEHRRAWARVEAVSQQFETFTPEQEQSAAVNALDASSRVRKQRRRALKMLTLLCTTGGVGWMTARLEPVQRTWLAFASDYSTAVGETRDVLLADGTQVWLNTASALNARYQPDLRRLVLLGGEILIETAQDPAQPARPFVVDTAQGRMRALGTRFTVRQMDGMTRLSVYAGAVEITPANSAAAPQIIDAGQQVLFSAEQIETPVVADAAHQAWAKGVLFADQLTLAEFVAELSRYHQGYLACAPEVADLRVVGAYPLHDMNKTFAMLETALPVKVKSTFSWWVSIQAR